MSLLAVWVPPLISQRIANVRGVRNITEDGIATVSFSRLTSIVFDRTCVAPLSVILDLASNLYLQGPGLVIGDVDGGSRLYRDLAQSCFGRGHDAPPRHKRHFRLDVAGASSM